MRTQRPLPKVLFGLFVALATVAWSLTGAVPMVSAAPFAYVSSDNGTTGMVTVIDAANYTMIGSVQVGRFPSGVGVNAAGTKAYVANTGEASVSVVETTATTGKPATLSVTTVLLTRVPTAVASTADGTVAYATHSDGTISMISSAATQYDVALLSVLPGTVLRSIVVNNAGTRLFVGGVAPDGRGSVVVVDPTLSGVLATLIAPTDFAPEGLALNPSETRLYAVGSVSNGNGLVIGVDPNAPATQASLVLGASVSPVGVVVHPVGNLVYVSTRGLKSVMPVYFPANALLKPVVLAPINGVRTGVGLTPVGVAVDATGERVFVLSNDGSMLNGTLSVLDPVSQTIVKAFSLPSPTTTLGKFVGGGAPDASAALKEQLDKANSTIAALTTQLATANGTIATLNADLKVAMDTVAALKADLTTRDATIAALNDKLNAMKAELDAAVARANSAEGTVASLKAELAAVNESTKKLADDLESANLTIASFVRRLVTGQTDANVATVARDAADKQIKLAIAKWGPNDERVKHAKKDFAQGQANFKAGHFQRATKDFVDAYETCWRIRRS